MKQEKKNGRFVSACERISAVANECPDRTAVVFKDKKLSYCQLLTRARQIALSLVQQGVVPGDRVGLHMTRSDDMVAAMLGIFFAGCAYVPLDPAFPVARLDYIARDAGIRHLIHDGNISLEDLPPFCVNLKGLPKWGPLDGLKFTESLPDYDDLAYVIYTSGSTGKPKGVRVHHGAVTNFLESMQNVPGIGPEDRLLAVTTPSFDISVLEIFLPLMVGATVVVASGEDIVDGGALTLLVEAERISVLQATPATWKMMFLAGWEGAANLVALCGGEPLEPALAGRLLGNVKALWNMYGPTETTVWSTCCRISNSAQPISVGMPIQNTTIHILDDNRCPVPTGQLGELYIGGAGVAKGYTDPVMTAARFLDISFGGPGERIYQTGDIASLQADGSLRLHGRCDDQVKIRGYRIELEEIQRALGDIEDILEAAVVIKPRDAGEPILAAFVVPRLTAQFDGGHLRRRIARTLPDYMIPHVFVELETLPLTPNGKIDRKALAELELSSALRAEASESSATDPAALFTDLVSNALGGSNVPMEENLFQLGIDSLQANFLVATFSRLVKRRISVARLFANPTVGSFLAAEGFAAPVNAGPARHVRADEEYPPLRASAERPNAVAIVGAAGRFPGASTLEDFWDILFHGRETITRFSAVEDDPLMDPELTSQPGYVRARGMIKDPDMFDANFFGIPPNDAAAMDPQQRVFLEIAWEAMENAGYDPARFDGEIGVYAGMGNNLYFHYNVSTRPDLIRMIGEVQAEIGREKDHIATLVSHKLNLTGPSLSVHTACSTGLVAIDSACTSLLMGHSDMALAGAIELRSPQMSGQVHELGGVFTADGHCRPFSDNASGTMFSDGAGVVVLRRLADALANGDNILGVIIGSAVNHDGANKKSYLAPSVGGQMQVIAKAHERAGIKSRSIGYMEAHGTATPVGDPIEFEALKAVFESETAERNYCALGSVKANLGHPTTAAGVVGVIKLCLALHHRHVPPLINFRQINPNIDLSNSPFYIPTEGKDWERGPGPRRAGISSFGFCGTNAHMVIEEAPEIPTQRFRESRRPIELLVLSAMTKSALSTLANNLNRCLASRSEDDLTDAAYTLATGRAELRYRSFVLRSRGTVSGGAAGLISHEMSAAVDSRSKRPHRLAFVFAGQGSQYPYMGRDLYRSEPSFRGAFDRCADFLTQHLQEDIRTILISEPGSDDERAAMREKLNNTQYTQPAIFCLEYALASMWMAWGLRPDLLVGHSIGEFACAVIANVMSLEDASRLIVTRGRLMSALPNGAMLAARLPATEVPERAGISVAAINGPNLTVLAGSHQDIAELTDELDAKGVRCQRLHTSHAFHSWMMEDAVAPFREAMCGVALKPPSIPVISTVTGEPLRPEEAVDPGYWANHLRQPVLFASAIAKVWESPETVVLEIGPRGTLAGLAGAQRRSPKQQVAIPSLADSSEDNAESASVLNALGQLWAQGLRPDWRAFFEGSGASKARLPNYPFERKRYWIEPAYLHHDRDTPMQVSRGQSVALTESLSCQDRSESASSAPDVDAGAVLATLYEILEEVSGESLRDQPPSSTFFELGLDSLLLTPITYMIKARFGVPVTFRQLTTDLNTPLTVCAYIDRALGTGTAGTMAAFSAANDTLPDTRTEVPLSSIQRAMLMNIATDASYGLGCLETVLIGVRGPLRRDAIEGAARQLIASHPSLRMQVGADDRGTVPGGLAGCDVCFLQADAADLPAMIEGEMSTPLTMGGGANLRITVISQMDDGHNILLTVHSLVCDGWSLDILIEDFCAAYSALTSPGAPPMRTPDLPWQFDRQIGRVSDPGLHSSEAIAPLLVDVAPRNQCTAVGRTGSQTIEIAEQMTAALRKLASRHHTSLFVLCLAATGRALGGRDDDEVGGDRVLLFQMAGQAAVNLPRLVGQYANWVPLSWSPSDRTSDWADLRALREKLIDAQESLVVALKRQAAGIQTDCLLNVGSISVIHTKRLPRTAYAIPGLHVDYTFPSKSLQTQALVLHLLEFPDRMEIVASYRHDIFGAERACSVLRRLADSLNTMAEAVETQLHQTSLD